MSITPTRKSEANLNLARSLIKAGLAENLILKAASISTYQLHQLQREIQAAIA
jgi:hypothetical protein